jgi:hypothetical protein
MEYSNDPLEQSLFLALLAPEKFHPVVVPKHFCNWYAEALLLSIDPRYELHRSRSWAICAAPPSLAHLIEDVLEALDSGFIKGYFSPASSGSMLNCFSSARKADEWYRQHHGEGYIALKQGFTAQFSQFCLLAAPVDTQRKAL